MKDIPTEIPEGLTIGAMNKREDSRDVLISEKYTSLDHLPEGTTIGTSSLRRKAQLLNYRPDLKIVDVRGNLDTRVRKMSDGQFEGIIVAAAGIHRMGWAEKISQYIPSDIILSAVGQGSIGIEVRSEDYEISRIIEDINHEETFIAIAAERSLLKRLEGGCQIPIGALGTVDNGILNLEAIVSNLDGTKLLRQSLNGSAENSEELGIELAEKMLSLGADEILAEVLSTGIRNKKDN